MHTIRRQVLSEQDGECRYMVSFDAGSNSRYNLVYFSNAGDAIEFCSFLNGGTAPLKLAESGWRELIAQWPNGKSEHQKVGDSDEARAR